MNSPANAIVAKHWNLGVRNGQRRAVPSRSVGVVSRCVVVAFWRKRDSRGRGVTTFLVSWVRGRSAFRGSFEVGRRFDVSGGACPGEIVGPLMPGPRAACKADRRNRR